jgi:hypothetical protein
MAGALTVQDFASSYGDPLANIQKGSDYVTGLFDQAAKLDAGRQFNQGNYKGAATALANRGDIAGSQAVTHYGQQQFQQQHDYLKQAVPVFQQIWDKTSGNGANPQAGTQALLNAFDHITPELKQSLGADDQTIAQYRDMLAKDPQGTLQALGAGAQKEYEYQKVGDTLYVIDKSTGQPVGKYEGQQFHVVNAGGSLVQTGGDGAVPQAASPAGAAPPGAVSPSPGPGGASPFFPGGVNPQAVSTIESGNDPNAVSPAGAVGTMQTMPATLRDPGFGVAPAADNSPQEQTRVGNDYLQAMTAKYGPAVGLVAQNMGPGATERWIAKGGHFSDLPDETQKYVGRAAVEQAMQSQRGAQPQAQTDGARVVYSAPPKPEKAPPKLANDQEVDFYAGLGLQDPTSLSRMFTGPEGRAELTQVRTRMSEMAAAAGLSPAEVVAMRAESKSNVVALYSLVKQRAFVESNSETARKAGGYVLSLAPKGGAQGQSPIFNKWRQWIRGEVKGDADVGKFNFAINTLASEYAKVKTGAYGSAGNTDTAQKEAENLLRSYDNLATLKGRIQAMYKEMDFKKQSYADQERSLRADIAGAMPGTKKPNQPKPQNSGKPIRIDINGNPL